LLLSSVDLFALGAARLVSPEKGKNQ
jgi:hypothetical protein